MKFWLALLLQIVVRNYAQAPNPPFTLAATSRSVVLSWTASTSSVDGYYVYRGTVPGGPYTKIGTVNASPFTDIGVTGGSTYYYVTTAFSGTDESGYSNESSATIPASSPQCVSLAWSSIASATYNLYRGTTSGGPYTRIASGLTSPAFVDSNVTHVTNYFYVVRAVINGVENSNSNEILAVVP